MWRVPAIGFIFMVILACDDSPLEGDPQNSVIAEGDTVSFEGLEATLGRFNAGWVPLPSEGFEGFAFPPPDDVLMTFRIEITNLSNTPRSFSAESFSLRAIPFTFGSEGGEETIMSVLPDGRIPRLADERLDPGETIQGWLTYSVPRRLDPWQILWRPRSDVTLGIDVPSFAQGRIESSLVFGRVTGPGGNPRPGLVLEISPVETFPGIPGVDSLVGQCRGKPASVRQVVTDDTGWYQDTISVFIGDEFCIDVRAVSDDGEMGQTRSSGIVRMGSIGNPFAEIPRVRIDLQLEGDD